MKRLAAALLLAALALALAPAAAAACAGAWTTAELEREVMCLTCNQRLDQSNSALADNLRAYIGDRCAAGWSKERVKDALVARFGPEIPAAPPRRGFDLLAWVVPFAALAAGAAVAAAFALRWSRSRGPEPPPEPALAADLEARIDADLDRQR
jgi:cytochrome c-type biogenesis protein CcmH